MKYWLCQTIVLIFITVSTTCIGQTIEFIAHRGVSYIAPENTMSSVLLAWQLDADAVEVDVYLSADNRIVVIHDKDTKRTGGKEFLVSETKSDQLRQLDVGSYKDKKYAGERIPFLEEVIESIGKNKKLYVEVKCGVEIIPYLTKMIQENSKKSQISIISFNLDVVAQAKKQMPTVPAYWLVGSKRDKKSNEYIKHSIDLIKVARKHNLDGLDVSSVGVTKRFVKAIHNAEMELYVWTVDDPGKAQKLIALGVDGITTNRPAWLKKQVAKKEQ